MSILPPDPVFILRGDMSYVHSTCFLDSEQDFSRTLLAATESGFVYLWDLDRNKVKSKHEMGESIMKIHSVGNTIITQEKSGILKVWNPAEAAFQMSSIYNFYGGFCRSIIIDDLIFIPQDKGAIDIVNLNNMTVLKQLQPEDETSTLLCLEKVILNNKSYLLAGYESGNIILFDLNTFKQCNNIKLNNSVLSMTFDDYTRRTICGTDANQLQLFSLNSSLEMSLKCEVSIVNNGCNIVKLRPDKKIFISGGWDNRIRVHSWKTLRILVVLTPHRKAITDVQFSPNIVEQYDSKIIACSSADGGISLWDIYK